MKLLEPVVQLIGRLSFRNKLRGTALIFGLPLLAVTSLLLMAINERVENLGQERAALHVQLPALALLSNLYQLSAVAEGIQEGDDSLIKRLPMRQASSLNALNDLRQAAAQRGLRLEEQVADGKWLGRWDAIAKQIAAADASGLADLSSNLRGELDAANGKYGLLSDGDVAGSRLLDVMTSHMPGLVEAGGRAAGIGTVVLIKQSVRGSRRSDLILLRGNLDTLVMWSIDTLRKVGGEHPMLAATLDDASGHLNTAFSSLQEAITIKMLDTTDYGMTPEAYLTISEKALAETLLSAGMLAEATDSMLLERLTVLQLQRDLVIGAIALALLCVLAGFLAAYISIMRGINGLSDAVGTMAAGNLGARVEVSSSDELGEVGERFNLMAENLAQRTAELHEKTNDINGMLQNLPQGILTIVGDGSIHPEYSAYLESIFEAADLGGSSALALLFDGTALGADARAQLEASIAACIGEDVMNFEFNSHLLPLEARKPMPDGREKILEMTWAPICDTGDVVEKLMVCVRDVTELRQLQAESEHQKRELEMIGQILKVNQEKFHEFVAGSKNFIAENEALLAGAATASPELVTQLFRNMHTIKGNARTYGLLHLTNVVHQAEQAYDELRKSADARFDQPALLAQLNEVAACLDEYLELNEVKLGRKGPGRRGSAEKYLMINREQMAQTLTQLDAYNLQACTQATLAAALAQVKFESPSSSGMSPYVRSKQKNFLEKYTEDGVKDMFKEFYNLDLKSKIGEINPEVMLTLAVEKVLNSK